jgi:chromosome partitioning protein
MTHQWVGCSVCAKQFLPRFAYQVERSATEEKFYCSVSCRTEKVRSTQSARTGSGSHCGVCTRPFELEFAYQVVATTTERDVVCSEVCRETWMKRRQKPAPQPARPSRVIAVLNQKGGTGKTTTSVSFAAGLAERGFSTLLIDLDAQGSVGVSLGIRGSKSLYHVLIDGISPQEAAVPVRKNLDIITADQTVAAAELELVNAPDRSRVLLRRMREMTQKERPYDYILLDCAPSLSLLNQNALLFAREVLVPVSCDYLALVGVKQILRTLKHVNQDLLHPVEVLAVLPTFYDIRNRISKQAIDALEGHFKDRVMPPIRVNAKLKEAPSFKKSIFEYAPESHGAEDYARAVSWLVDRERPAEMDAATAAAAEATVSATRNSASYG